jgi:hypothetical protein
MHGFLTQIPVPAWAWKKTGAKIIDGADIAGIRMSREQAERRASWVQFE